jgi:hypothetical protein
MLRSVLLLAGAALVSAQVSLCSEGVKGGSQDLRIDTTYTRCNGLHGLR